MSRFFLALAALCCSPFLRAADTARAFHLPSLYHVGYWVHDPVKIRAFYGTYLGFEEPYVLNRANGALQMIVLKVNERQVLYMFPDPSRIKPNGDNLDHLGLETDDAAALHDYLLAQGLEVKKPALGHIGDLILGVKDPDGHAFEVTQLEPKGQLMLHQGKSLAPGRISSHLRSATIMVSDLPASLHFYRDILGFKDIGTVGNATRVQVPDGADFLELVPTDVKPDAPGARSVPQYTLEVPDAAKAFAVLTARAGSGDFPPPTAVSTGADGKKQTSVVDPEGTRVILSE